MRRSRCGGGGRRSRRRSASRRSRSSRARLCADAAGWAIPPAPILADCAYGDDSRLPDEICMMLELVVRCRRLLPDLASTGRRRPLRCPSATAKSDGSDRLRVLTANRNRCAPSPNACRRLRGRRCLAERQQRARRSRAVSRSSASSPPIPCAMTICRPAEEWLIIEWPPGNEAPSDYWLSNLPSKTTRERLARLARLRWTIELDYRQLKGELGLDHYEGRSYARLPSPLRACQLCARIPHTRKTRPKSAAAGLTLPQTVLLLQPVLRCWAGRCRTCHQPDRPQPAHTLSSHRE